MNSAGKNKLKRHAVVQPTDKSIHLIPLTQGQNAIVDAADYAWLSQWHWFAHWAPHTKSFYAKRNSELVNGKRYAIMMHRQILGLAREDEHEGDHKNGNTLDYRRSNLRIATVLQNQHNRRMPSRNTSGYKGIYWQASHRKWHARILIKGVRKSLGYFDTKEAAYAAYCIAAPIYHGEFARLA